jgi:hypothetical protein
LFIVLKDYLNQNVKTSRGKKHVIYLVQLGEGLGEHTRVSAGSNTDHGLAIEAKLHWVGYGNNLHHAGLGELLDALANCGLTEANRLADFGVGAAPVLLELLDDRLGYIVQLTYFGACYARHTSILPVFLLDDLRNRKKRHISQLIRYQIVRITKNRANNIGAIGFKHS